MTTVLDRLERSGVARRVRDGADRRRVLVEVTPRAQQQAGRFYSEHLAFAERLYHRYTGAQLELLLQLVREGREFNDVQAARVERQNRAERAKKA
jgi:DNA-binding MarR family transcriptional regulator